MKSARKYYLYNETCCCDIDHPFFGSAMEAFAEIKEIADCQNKAKNSRLLEIVKKYKNRDEFAEIWRIYKADENGDVDIWYSDYRKFVVIRNHEESVIMDCDNGEILLQVAYPDEEDSGVVVWEDLPVFEATKYAVMA